HRLAWSAHWSGHLQPRALRSPGPRGRVGALSHLLTDHRGVPSPLPERGAVVEHDIIIRNGLIVDGTGAEPTRGDVAIRGEQITAVGHVDGRARRELDAEGRFVTPGFVDVHTHLDAQLFWDRAATPLSFHGVTTVVLGNCGVTFAPCRPKARG